MAPEHWVFLQNSFGKPAIGNDIPIAEKIEFSISHTAGLIVCGVRSKGALGVDIENLHSRPAPLNIANAYFSAMEKEALSLLPPELQIERFFQYWTLKESYIKARGLGLSIPLDEFSFHFPKPDQVRFSVSQQLEDQPSNWRFWQLRPSKDHLASICAKRTANDCQQLVIRQVIPFKSEIRLDHMPVLASG